MYLCITYYVTARKTQCMTCVRARVRACADLETRGLPVLLVLPRVPCPSLAHFFLFRLARDSLRPGYTPSNKSSSYNALGGPRRARDRGGWSALGRMHTVCGGGDAAPPDTTAAMNKAHHPCMNAMYKAHHPCMNAHYTHTHTHIVCMCVCMHIYNIHTHLQTHKHKAP
jgi:hypothetical protein